MTDVGDASAEPEERRVHDLEDLGRHCRISGHDVAHAGERGILRGELLLELGVQRRRAREALRPRDGGEQLGVVQVPSERAGAIDRLLQQVGLTRLRYVLVGHARGSERVHLLAVAGEDDPHHVGVAFPHLIQQRHAVHAGHPDLGHDEVELGRRRRSERLLSR